MRKPRRCSAQHRLGRWIFFLTDSFLVPMLREVVSAEALCVNMMLILDLDYINVT